MSNKPYKIVTYPDPILKSKNRDITDFDSLELKEIINRMIVTLNAYQGVGLAAPQVGIGINLLVVKTHEEPLVIINPKIISHSLLKNEGEEGCLSLPGIWGKVKRYNSIEVQGYNPQGEKIKIKAKGFFARVIQHEIDHLNGILIINRTKKLFKGERKLNLDQNL